MLVLGLWCSSQTGDGGVEKPVCFFSKKCNKHQLNYSVTEKETRALIWSLQYFGVYVGSGPVVVFTDHNPLTFLNSLQCPNQRLMRWASMSSTSGERITVWQKHCPGLHANKVTTVVSAITWLLQILINSFKDPVAGAYEVMMVLGNSRSRMAVSCWIIYGYMGT